MLNREAETTTIVVVHPMALLATPAVGGIVRGFVAAGDCLLAGQQEAGFVEVELPTGQRGFVPRAACGPLALNAAHSVSEVRVAQPVSLYRQPIPGTQFVDTPEHERNFWIILPEDRLLLLGRDQAFVLVQRADGRMGYVPAAICGIDNNNPDAFIPLGPLDLGWIGLGGGWFMPNWLAVKGMVEQAALGLALPVRYLEIALILGIVASLWSLTPRPRAARSFAVGIIMTYALARTVTW